MEQSLYDDALRNQVQCPICHREVGDGVVRHKEGFGQPLWQFHCHQCGRSFFLEFTDDERGEHARRRAAPPRMLRACSTPAGRDGAGRARRTELAGAGGEDGGADDA